MLPGFDDSQQLFTERWRRYPPEPEPQRHGENSGDRQLSKRCGDGALEPADEGSCPIETRGRYGGTDPTGHLPIPSRPLVFEAGGELLDEGLDVRVPAGWQQRHGPG